jgi:hypothetical protein
VTATRVRDWATIDYYALLGVERGATNGEITQAFRAKAKLLHPDAAGNPDDATDFGDISAAYTVLSDQRRRKEYDRVRAAAVPDPVATRISGPGRPRKAPQRTRWTRRRAWYAVIGGSVCAILGVVSGVLTWTMHEHDAQQRARFIPVVAARADTSDIRFTTRTGAEVLTREPHQHGEGSGTGATVNVRYDPANPQHVIVDAGTFGRDITLAVVALKFLVGGLVFLVLGLRHLRRTSLRTTAVR